MNDELKAVREQRLKHLLQCWGIAPHELIEAISGRAFRDLGLNFESFRPDPRGPTGQQIAKGDVGAAPRFVPVGPQQAYSISGIGGAGVGSFLGNGNTGIVDFDFPQPGRFCIAIAVEAVEVAPSQRAPLATQLLL